MGNIYQLLSRSPSAINEVAERVRAGVDIHDRSLHISKRTVLEMVAAQSDPKYECAIRLLVALGADINSAHPSSGLTPLHNAALYAPVETIRTLCELGANPNACDSKGRTPAFLIIERTTPMDSMEQMRGALLALFDAGGDSLAKDGSGMTLLKATRKADLQKVIRSAQIGDRIAGAVDVAVAVPKVSEAPVASASKCKSMQPI